MKKVATFFLLCSFIFVTPVAIFSQDSVQEEEVILEIDLLPMYGSSPEYGSWQKTEEQLQGDRLFLETSDEEHPSRKEACLDYLRMGWELLAKGDWATSMRRANHSWLLDAENPDVYTLFAAVLNFHEAHGEALNMLAIAIDLNPNDVNLYDIYFSESIDLHRRKRDDSKVLRFLSMLDNVSLTDSETIKRVEKLKEEAISYLEQEVVKK